MKEFTWSLDKNNLLKSERGISFEGVIVSIKSGGLLDDLKHPNQEAYPKQRIMIVEMSGYAYLVPYVEDTQSIFLKTIIPSRKATRKYLRGDKK